MRVIFGDSWLCHTYMVKLFSTCAVDCADVPLSYEKETSSYVNNLQSRFTWNYRTCGLYGNHWQLPANNGFHFAENPTAQWHQMYLRLWQVGIYMNAIYEKPDVRIIVVCFLAFLSLDEKNLVVIICHFLFSFFVNNCFCIYYQRWKGWFYVLLWYRGLNLLQRKLCHQHKFLF